MKKLNYLLLFVLASLFFACSSEDEEPKLVEKDVTIEVEMGGDYSDYLVTFTVHTMLSGTSTFVTPQLIEPSALEWTQIIEQGNSYTVTYEPSASSLEVQSTSDIHSLGFVFNAVPLDRNTDDTFDLMSASIRVLADGEVYREYDYEALPSDQTSVPLADEINID
ncbi:hypothetical protein FHS59_002589 [Algoriphagus iocasae]|uniref:Uncharacterized protein n=2 Tax=Algoriphagus TaxID=246875 RepID=A0A1I7A8S9_9BACT|nr:MULTISPECIES: hypothetical protein [Algoriphagus]MBB6326961.1 hypothetical protein [Algoriphagus iocasae]SFT71260.1 hypothetical protein SAMN04489724_1760 [Algoriphagus locisalis]